MPLTPLDIHNKSFNKGFRGYDEDEVNEFLEQVMKDYELVLREKKMLEEKYADAREKLGHFNHIEDALNKLKEITKVERYDNEDELLK